jgi:hypothetical protein
VAAAQARGARRRVGRLNGLQGPLACAARAL